MGLLLSPGDWKKGICFSWLPALSQNKAGAIYLIAACASCPEGFILWTGRKAFLQNKKTAGDGGISGLEIPPLPAAMDSAYKKTQPFKFRRFRYPAVLRYAFIQRKNSFTTSV